MEGFFVNLSNTWFRNGEEESMLNKYGSDSLLIYTLLLRNLTYRNEIIFSINDLGNKLGVKQTNSRMVNKIKNTLQKINDNIIEIFQEDNFKTKVSKYEYNKIYYAKILIDIPKDKYFKIFDDEINKLLNYIRDKNIDKFEISTYLIFLLSCIGNKEGEDNYKICYPSLEYSFKILHISEGNLTRYNKILEESKVIVIDNAGMNKDKNDNFKNVANTYSRYKDKEFLEKAVNKQREKVQVAVDYNSKKLLQNKSRSKAKEISIWKEEHNIHGLTKKEFEELYILEKQHYDIRFRICSEKIHINGGYITLYCTKNGKKKEYNNYEIYTKEN